jgi:hypothetical protein
MPAETSDPVPAPWSGFLDAIDARLTVPTDIHCIGGFVMTLQYGLSRATADVDVMEAAPTTALTELQRIAGRGSELEGRFRVYLQVVRVAMYPENYASRLVPMWPERFRRLRLFALEAHDLALTKLDRNSDVDRQDVQQLAAAGLINAATLRKRYEEEYRPNLASGEKKLDLTMRLWTEMCWPDRPPSP